LAEYFPVLGNKEFNKYNLIDINALKLPVNATQEEMNFHLGKYVEKFAEANYGVPYGGFLEERCIYQSSDHFSNEAVRNIHLGIDLWVKAHTPVFAAKDGKIHSVAYNSAQLDYGWCIIIEYSDNEFVLYGHMSSEILDNSKSGDKILSGEIIGYTGDMHENGGWYPHLHLQVMNTMLDYKGDFPGVSSKKDLEYYRPLIKNPVYLL
jgi:murein DD-endopeptidase MepM/ murein hydrolase activator NlpD